MNHLIRGSRVMTLVRSVMNGIIASMGALAHGIATFTMSCFQTTDDSMPSRLSRLLERPVSAACNVFKRGDQSEILFPFLTPDIVPISLT